MTRRSIAAVVSSAIARAKSGMSGTALIYWPADAVSTYRNGKLGKGAGSQLTDWEAGGVEWICANADLVAVKPAVAIAVRDPGVRAERGFVRVQ